MCCYTGGSWQNPKSMPSFFFGSDLFTLIIRGHACHMPSFHNRNCPWRVFVVIYSQLYLWQTLGWQLWLRTRMLIFRSMQERRTGKRMHLVLLFIKAAVHGIHPLSLSMLPSLWLNKGPDEPICAVGSHDQHAACGMNWDLRMLSAENLILTGVSWHLKAADVQRSDTQCRRRPLNVAVNCHSSMELRPLTARKSHPNFFAHCKRNTKMKKYKKNYPPKCARKHEIASRPNGFKLCKNF